MNKPREILLILLTALVVQSCGSQPNRVQLNPIKEAYSMLNQGKNASAIVLLEAYLSTDKKNNEAKTVLASAYMGQAGIDVFKMYDAYKDVFFAHSVADEFTKPAGKIAELAKKTSEPEKDPAPVEKFIAQMDSSILQFQEFMRYISRMPKVEQEKWPLIDRALTILDSIDEPTKDIKLYRVFARVIYVRSYLGIKIVGNPDFGTEKWLRCLDFEEAIREFQWLIVKIDEAGVDFHNVYPDRIPVWLKMEPAIQNIYDTLSDLRGTPSLISQLTSSFGLTTLCGDHVSPAPADSTSTSPSR